ncbi:MAG: hypothetical protein ILM98_05540 [Kiritimatiellae bacterium]|nr:hypothetical protein [Kiritimatiellia bacterium]
MHFKLIDAMPNADQFAVAGHRHHIRRANTEFQRLGGSNDAVVVLGDIPNLLKRSHAKTILKIIIFGKG